MMLMVIVSVRSWQVRGTVIFCSQFRNVTAIKPIYIFMSPLLYIMFRGSLSVEVSALFLLFIFSVRLLSSQHCLIAVTHSTYVAMTVHTHIKKSYIIIYCHYYSKRTGISWARTAGGVASRDIWGEASMGSTGYTWHASDTNQVQHVNVHWHNIANLCLCQVVTSGLQCCTKCREVGKAF